MTFRRGDDDDRRDQPRVPRSYASYARGLNCTGRTTVNVNRREGRYVDLGKGCEQEFQELEKSSHCFEDLLSPS